MPGGFSSGFSSGFGSATYTTDTSVKYFDSDMFGATGVTNTIGDLILRVIDPCAVDGFGSSTMSNYAVASDVATITTSGAHNIEMITDRLGPVMVIAGCAEPALDGEWRLTDVPSTTTMTFATDGISDTSGATSGTIKRAPFGFTKAYSATNEGAYYSAAVQGTGRYLHVDDTNAGYAELTMYESMDAIDSGTGASTTVYHYTSNSASARDWRAYGDDRAFYIFTDTIGTQTNGGTFFGDFISFRPSDSYGCALISSATSTGNTALLTLNAGAGANYICRSYTGTGSAISGGLHSHRSTVNTMGLGAMTAATNPVDDRVHVAGVDIWDGSTVRRGIMPGIWNSLQDATALAAEYGKVMDHDDGVFVIQRLYSSYPCLMEIETAWR